MELSMEDSTGRYVRWSDHCVWQPFGDTLTVVKVIKPESGLLTEDMSSGVRLNAVGRDIWNFCDGTRTVEGITQQILEQYEGPQDKIRESVKNAITNLEGRGLLTYEEDVTPYDLVDISPQNYPVWSDTIIWNEVEGRVMAMDNDSGFSVDFAKETGEMWKLCDGARTVEEITTMLEEKGIITEDIPPSSFKLFLKQFVKLSLITMKDTPVR